MLGISFLVLYLGVMISVKRAMLTQQESEKARGEVTVMEVGEYEYKMMSIRVNTRSQELVEENFRSEFEEMILNTNSFKGINEGDQSLKYL